MTTNTPLPQSQLAPFVALNAVAVTPSDITILAFAALYIGVTGDVEILPFNSITPVVFKAVPVGMLPVSGQKVMATNTTATNIVALN